MTYANLPLEFALLETELKNNFLSILIAAGTKPGEGVPVKKITFQRGGSTVERWIDKYGHPADAPGGDKEQSSDTPSQAGGNLQSTMDSVAKAASTSLSNLKESMGKQYGDISASINQHIEAEYMEVGKTLREQVAKGYKGVQPWATKQFGEARMAYIDKKLRDLDILEEEAPQEIVKLSLPQQAIELAKKHKSEILGVGAGLAATSLMFFVPEAAIGLTIAKIAANKAGKSLTKKAIGKQLIRAAGESIVGAGTVMAVESAVEKTDLSPMAKTALNLGAGLLLPGMLSQAASASILAVSKQAIEKNVAKEVAKSASASIPEVATQLAKEVPTIKPNIANRVAAAIKKEFDDLMQATGSTGLEQSAVGKELDAITKKAKQSQKAYNKNSKLIQKNQNALTKEKISLNERLKKTSNAEHGLKQAIEKRINEIDNQLSRYGELAENRNLRRTKEVAKDKEFIEKGAKAIEYLKKQEGSILDQGKKGWKHLEDRASQIGSELQKAAIIKGFKLQQAAIAKSNKIYNDMVSFGPNIAAASKKVFEQQVAGAQQKIENARAFMSEFKKGVIELPTTIENAGRMKIGALPKEQMANSKKMLQELSEKLATDPNNAALKTQKDYWEKAVKEGGISANLKKSAIQQAGNAKNAAKENMDKAIANIMATPANIQQFAKRTGESTKEFYTRGHQALANAFNESRNAIGGAIGSAADKGASPFRAAKAKVVEKFTKVQKDVESLLKLKTAGEMDNLKAKVDTCSSLIKKSDDQIAAIDKEISMLKKGDLESDSFATERVSELNDKKAGLQADKDAYTGMIKLAQEEMSENSFPKILAKAYDIPAQYIKNTAKSIQQGVDDYRSLPGLIKGQEEHLNRLKGEYLRSKNSSPELVEKIDADIKRAERQLRDYKAKLNPVKTAINKKITMQNISKSIDQGKVRRPAEIEKTIQKPKLSSKPSSPNALKAPRIGDIKGRQKELIEKAKSGSLTPKEQREFDINEKLLSSPKARSSKDTSLTNDITGKPRKPSIFEIQENPFTGQKESVQVRPFERPKEHGQEFLKGKISRKEYQKAELSEAKVKRAGLRQARQAVERVNRDSANLIDKGFIEPLSKDIADLEKSLAGKRLSIGEGTFAFLASLGMPAGMIQSLGKMDWKQAAAKVESFFKDVAQSKGVDTGKVNQWIGRFMKSAAPEGASA